VNPVQPISRTATGQVVPTARERARPAHEGEDPRLGWLASIGVFLLALFLRLWNLGEPDEFAFDETYYAKDAWSLLHHGHVREYPGDADEKILDGATTGLWKDDPSMVVHPEVGKWMIALGEWAFGMDPFGWRIMAAVCGALMVLVLCRLVRRITGSTLLGCVAGLLLCLDGMHLVLSRLALLDIFLAFWVLLAASCLVLDRDWLRARLAAGRDVRFWRPWLLVAGVCFGLAIGVKWSGLYALAAFGPLVVWWSTGARLMVGVRRARLKGVLTDGVPAFLALVGVAGLVYTASWTGWLLNAHEYERTKSQSQYAQFESWAGDCDKESLKGVESDDSRQWATARQPDAAGLGEVRQSLHSLWLYHRDVYTFHTVFLNCSEHTYASDPLAWPLLARPVGVNVENDIQPGDQGCAAEEGSHCIREVLLIGTPVLWWGGVLALLYAGYAFVLRRDWRYGLALVGTLSLWLPWERDDERPIFLFYASAFFPFVVIAVTLLLGEILGRAPAGSRRRTVGTVVAGAFVVLVLLNFAWFWPIWTNGLLTDSEWRDRIWLERWI
jgi:dolichyl-phosphate-mannose-protein mannosyltransferase